MLYDMPQKKKKNHTVLVCYLKPQALIDAIRKHHAVKLAFPPPLNSCVPY